MIRLAAFDIDRTILPTHGGELAPETVAAIGRLREQGIATAIASGRMLHLITPELRALGFDYYILSNGAFVYDREGRLISQETLNQDVVRAFREEMCKRGFAFDVRYANGMLQGNPHADVRVEMAGYWEEKGINRSVDPDFQWYFQPPEGQQVTSFDACIPVERQEEMRVLFPQLEFLPVTDGPMCDINPAGVSKATGIHRICGHMGITMEQVIAFGDDRNDLEMIKEAGIGVAMGNALPSVQSVADYVTDNCADLGVVKALRHFGLIE